MGEDCVKISSYSDKNWQKHFENVDGQTDTLTDNKSRYGIAHEPTERERGEMTRWQWWHAV